MADVNVLDLMFADDALIYVLIYSGFHFDRFEPGDKTVKPQIKFLNKRSLCLLSTKELFSFCTLLVVDSFLGVYFVFCFHTFILWLLLSDLFLFSLLFSIQIACPKRGHACTDIWNNKEDILFGGLMRGKSRRQRVFLVISMFLLMLRTRPNSYHE